MKKEKNTDRISTFIGADASIDGSIEFTGTIRVDGSVKGNISSNGLKGDDFSSEFDFTGLKELAGIKPPRPALVRFK